MTDRRIVQEIKEAGLNQDPTIQWGLKDPSDNKKWWASINGPEGTPYQRFKLTLNITFPENYPFLLQKLILLRIYGIQMLEVLVIYVWIY